MELKKEGDGEVWKRRAGQEQREVVGSGER